MKHRKSPQRVCLFCGKSGHAKITGEHVWPQWIYGVLKMSPQVQTVHLDGLMREQRKWHASQKASFRVNEVCEQCNSEWLSNLETRSEPVLTPLIASNERTTLSAADQRVIEEWVLKMSLVSNATQRENQRIFERDHYRQFREHANVAPLATRVYLASYAEPTMVMTHCTWTPLRLDDMRFPSDPDAEELVTFTFVIGHLIAQLSMARTRSGDESTVSWVLEPQWALSVRQLTGRSADMRWPIVPPLRTGAELALFASRDEIRIRQQLRPGRIVVPTLRLGRR